MQKKNKRFTRMSKRARPSDALWEVQICENRDDYKCRGGDWTDTTTHLFSTKQLAERFVTRFERRTLREHNRYGDGKKYKTFNEYNASGEYCNTLYDTYITSNTVREELSESSDESCGYSSEVSDESSDSFVETSKTVS